MLLLSKYNILNGGIDMLLKTDLYVYVMEFKFDGTVEENLQKIDERDMLLLLSVAQGE